METKFKDLYILFSRQNTKIGRFIRIFLKNSRYSHVSVALDGSLYKVYSFSRKRFDSPFSGGFVREYPAHFIIGGRDLDVKLCRVELDQAAYEAARQRLEHCFSHSNRMLYNLYDAVAIAFHKRVRLRDAHTCVDFAAYLIGASDEVFDIGELEQRLDGCCVYEGSLMALIEKTGAHAPEDDDYFTRRGFFAAARDLFILQSKLWRRLHNDSARVGA